jgi:hypothetical protein
MITTSRLVLREWEDSDREPFALLNTDVRVMEFMPKALTPEESAVFVERICAHWRTHGFGLYATVMRHDHKFIGYIGLSVPTFESTFTPCVEIGWRLAAEYWNRGFGDGRSRSGTTPRIFNAESRRGCFIHRSGKQKLSKGHGEDWVGLSAIRRF